MTKFFDDVLGVFIYDESIIGFSFHSRKLCFIINFETGMNPLTFKNRYGNI